MARVRLVNLTEQVAEHLRYELARGRWVGQMPGKHELAVEFEVNNKTVETALRQLETKGVLIPRGAGRRRLIHLAGRPQRKLLRIALLLNETLDPGLDYMVELRHRLVEAGHAVQVAPRTLVDLHDSPELLGRLVGSTGADAWVVLGSAG